MPKGQKNRLKEQLNSWRRMSDVHKKIEREPIDFENDGNRLYGMIHHPVENTADRPAIILLSAGLKNRIGYGRLYVSLADFLAEQGFLTLRYDYHGCGDSDGRLSPTGAYHELHADINGFIQTGLFAGDTLRAIEFLKEKNRCSKFVLCGLCGGSNSSLYTSVLDKNIISIIMINFPITIDSKLARTKSKDSMNLWMVEFLYKSYLIKFFQPGAWLRFLTFKSDYKSIIKVFKTKIFKKNPEPEKKSSADKQQKNNKNNFNYDLLDKLTSYYDSGRNSYFIFAANDPISLDFETYFQNKAGKNLLTKYERQWEKIVIKDSNHSFTNFEWRVQLFNNILTCIKKEMNKK